MAFATSHLRAPQRRRASIRGRSALVAANRRPLRAELEGSTLELTSRGSLSDRARPAVDVHDGSLDLLRDTFGVIWDALACEEPHNRKVVGASVRRLHSRGH